MNTFVRRFLSACFLVLLVAGSVAAHTRESPTDKEAISATMKAIWETPDQPLAVEPIVLSGDYGLAGWVQGERGGRALLRKEDGHWVIVVCGGDSLKTVDVLESTGMDHHSAQSLAEGLAKAEATLPEAKLKLFASFEGLIKPDSAAGGHTPHVGHDHAH